MKKEDFYEASDTEGEIMRLFIETWWDQFNENEVGFRNIKCNFKMS